jgi:hypothetical protein
MIKEIGRLMKARYEQRALETSSIVFPLNIMKDPGYIIQSLFMVLVFALLLYNIPMCLFLVLFKLCSC